MKAKADPSGDEYPGRNRAENQINHARVNQAEKNVSRLAWMRPLVIILVLGLTVLLLWLGGRIQQLGRYGYPGIFLVNLLANATVILPVPGVVVTSAFGAVLHPFWVALAAGTGAALGELSGVLVGYSGIRAGLERIERHERIETLFARYRVENIHVLAFIPNPAVDLAEITAGAFCMPVRRFLLFCWIGKVIKMLAFSYTGATLFNLLGFP
ncbi:MAG: VTT domain-containing protein [Anaerolineaceae bacterium]|nr:VTT domain-containing protein [Anaerolineaceae bacterium]